MTKFIKDNLTDLLTPYGEKVFIKRSIKGRVFIDWHDMHSAHKKFGDERVETELRKIADFLKHIFRKYPNTYLSYISGDNIQIVSTEFGDEEILNIIYKNKDNLDTIAKLVCGVGFPDPLTKEVFYFWQNHPEHRFQLIYPPRNKNVCTLDLRHLRMVTEIYGMQKVEGEILNLINFIKLFFLGDRVFRTRCDEIWIFSSKKRLEIENLMTKISDNYNSYLKFDWGIGKNPKEAHLDILGKKKESDGRRTRKSDFEL